MNMTFYYRDAKNALSVLNVSDAESVFTARQMVLEHLHETKEIYYMPILGLIQGGKQ